MQLTFTKEQENIDIIKKKYEMNEADKCWCEKTITSLILKCADCHLPYLFGILTGHMSYDNAISFTDEYNFKLKIKHENGHTEDIWAPKFASPISIIKHFVKLLHIATRHDKQSIDKINQSMKGQISRNCQNQLNTYKYVNFNTLNKIGYQSYDEAAVFLTSCFKTYQAVSWRSLNEMENGKPLLHTDQMDKLLKNETSTAMLQAYMANQGAPYISTKGSMICELINAFLESFLRSKRTKSCKIAWMEVILQFLKWNIHVSNKYLTKEYDYRNRLNDFELRQLKNLCNHITHTTYINDKYIQNGHYYYIDNKCQKWVIQQAKEWFVDCQLKPQKPHWDFHCNNELRAWVIDPKKGNNALSYVHCQMIENYFHHIWNFEYIVTKAKKMGLTVVTKNNQMKITNN